MCAACGGLGQAKPVTRLSICAVHREADGKACAWDDVPGTELDPKLTLKARAEEMEQFRKHEVYEKVKEGVCWAVTGRWPIWGEMDRP